MKNVPAQPSEKYKTQVAARLQKLPLLFDFQQFNPAWSPSRMAVALRCEHVGEVESWLSGDIEPPIARLQQITAEYSLNTEWLIHGCDNPFSHSGELDLTNIETAFRTLFAQNDSGENPQTVALVRALNRVGNLMVIVFYPNMKFKKFHTRYHISGAIGVGGRIDLQYVFLTIEALFRSTNMVHITGYILKEEEFNRVRNGEQHPASILRFGETSTWWEDIWDKSMLTDANARGKYWDGWYHDGLAIVNAIESDERCMAIAEDIRARRLPIMNGPLNPPTRDRENQ